MSFHPIHRNLCLKNSQDNSDPQYRSFRNNVPALTALVVSFLILKFIYAVPAFKFSPTRPRDTLHKIPFLIIFSVLMLIGLHGTSIIKIFAILSVNFGIAKFGGGQIWVPFITWGFNGAVLYFNEIHSGYRFASIHPSFLVLVRFPPVLLSKKELTFSGCDTRGLSSVAYKLQYHDASSRLV